MSMQLVLAPCSIFTTVTHMKSKVALHGKVIKCLSSISTKSTTKEEMDKRYINPVGVVTCV